MHTFRVPDHWTLAHDDSLLIDVFFTLNCDELSLSLCVETLKQHDIPIYYMY